MDSKSAKIEGPMDMLAEYLNEHPEAAEKMKESQRVLQEKRKQQQLAQQQRIASKPRTYLRTTAKVGRNDPCPCGSEKKYKKCCLRNTT